MPGETITEKPTQTEGKWHCPECDELIGGVFHACWNCGATRDGGVDPSFQPAVKPTQPWAHCQTCGYPLRDLPGEFCPECGSPFNPDARDTPQEPVPESQPYLERQRRKWLRIWLISWVLFLAIGLFCFEFNSDSELAVSIAIIIGGGLGIMALIAPLVFFFSLFQRSD